MTPHPQHQYIITEHELRTFIEIANSGFGVLADNTALCIRSHPVPSEQEIRDKVLDEIWKYFIDNDCKVHISPTGNKYYWISGTFSVSGLMQLVEELRSKQGGL